MEYRPVKVKGDTTENTISIVDGRKPNDFDRLAIENITLLPFGIWLNRLPLDDDKGILYVRDMDKCAAFLMVFHAPDDTCIRPLHRSRRVFGMCSVLLTVHWRSPEAARR